MKATYINSFHNPNNADSKEILSCDSDAIKYKGYLIYQRIKSTCFDVVKDGICVGMYAGVNGAKIFIDGLS